VIYVEKSKVDYLTISLGEKSLVAAYRRERLSSGKIELTALDRRCWQLSSHRINYLYQ